jgi:hypothetical protein
VVGDCIAEMVLAVLGLENHDKILASRNVLQDMIEPLAHPWVLQHFYNSQALEITQMPQN